MPYTMEDFLREFRQKFVKELTPEERVEGLTPDERVRGLSPEERVRGLSPEEIERCLQRVKKDDAARKRNKKK
jgi:hypothetical protein